MNDETVNENVDQAEVFPENFEATMVPCPNCKETVPTSLYCLKCGYPLYMFRQAEAGIDVVLPPDEGSLSHMQAISKNLMNSISMKLWSVEQLKEGILEEDQFKRLEALRGLPGPLRPVHRQEEGSAGTLLARAGRHGP